MSSHLVIPRLLAGPPLDGTAERVRDHFERLGPVPPVGVGTGVIAELEASGLLGRGGAGFSVGRKWRAVAERKGGTAVVVANGAEGEAASWKDRVLMAHRPHLVIDGADLAAEAIGADEIVLYIGQEHEAAVAAMHRALMERSAQRRRPTRIVLAPISYVAGEATAVVNRINSGDARPTTTPPRVSQKGVAGQPTLVQNVESLAYAALIARFGAAWYRSAGRAQTRGTALVTVTGSVREAGVREIELGTTFGELATMAGIEDGAQAVILGGYFGTWAPVDEAWELPLDPAVMKGRGLTFGCGIVGVLGATGCGVRTTAEIMGYMADESAGQCGPCVYGLRAIADATRRVAGGKAQAGDLDDVRRWGGLVVGRGACHHPDGAAQLLASSLQVFAGEWDRHMRLGPCSGARARFDG